MNDKQIAWIEGKLWDGFTLGELWDAGVSTRELRAAGFTLPELRAAGFPVLELWDAGYSVPELREGRFTLRKLRATENRVQTLREEYAALAEEEAVQ